MRAFLSSLLHCLPIFWVLLLAGLVFRKKSRLSLLFLIGAVAWLVLVSTPALPNWVVRTLERQYLPFNRSSVEKDLPKIILVLGGGHTADPRLPENDQLSEGALKRLVEGIRIHRDIEGSRLVFSGYARPGLALSHAEVLGRTAIMLGVSRDSVSVISTPSNTMEESLEFRKKFGAGTSLILVTSAVHMPRAMMHFRQAGLNPIPAPTHYLVKIDPVYGRNSWWPSSGYLKRMNKAIHEYVGIWWGRLEWKRLSRGD